MALTSLLYKQGLWERHEPLMSRKAGEADKPTHVPWERAWPCSLGRGSIPPRSVLLLALPSQAQWLQTVRVCYSAVWRSEVGPGSQRARIRVCLQGWFPREDLGESHLLVFQLLESVCVFCSMLNQLSHTSPRPFLHLQSQQRWVKFCAVAPTSLPPPLCTLKAPVCDLRA